MGNKAKILSIKQNIIEVKSRKRNRHISIMPICSFLIVAILLCFSIDSIGMSEIANSMCYVYNPVNSLYSDNSSLVFASASLGGGHMDFTLPIVSGKYEILPNGNIEIEVTNSIIVKAIENGAIEEIGVTNDGIKFIKIFHSLDCFSYIENVDVVGVKQYEKVKKGQEIATAKLGEKITLKLYYAETKITNIKINQSKIIWKL